ncbi:MAG: Deoxyribose-phosphate aldolase, partial [uncultured Rubrobacteraceae bacterium]
GDEGAGVREDGGPHPSEAGRHRGADSRPLRGGVEVPLRGCVHPAVLRAARRERAPRHGREGGDGGLFPVRQRRDGGQDRGGARGDYARRVRDRRGDEHLQVPLRRVRLRRRRAREPHPGGERRRHEQRPERRGDEGHHRDGLPDGQDEAARHPNRGRKRRGLREDLDGLWSRRRHHRRRRPAARGGTGRAGRKSLGRYQDVGGGAGHTQRRGLEARYERERGGDGGGRGWRSTRV